MPYVSAQYTAPDPLDTPEMAKPIWATDDQGLVWSFREDNESADWLAYLAGGGTIAPYVPGPVQSWDVNAERDRRITGGFDFEGHRYQSDEFSQRNIADASQSADAAIAAGAVVGDYQWQVGATEDFRWIDVANNFVPMDAYDVRNFTHTMMRFKQAMIAHARVLKDTDPIPMDYTDDKYWPFDAARVV